MPAHRSSQSRHAYGWLVWLELSRRPTATGGVRAPLAAPAPAPAPAGAGAGAALSADDGPAPAAGDERPVLCGEPLASGLGAG